MLSEDLADADPEFVAVEISVIPCLSLRWWMGGFAGPAGYLGGWGVLLITQVLVLQDIVRVLARQLPRNRSYIDHSGKSGVMEAAITSGCTLKARLKLTHMAAASK